MKKRILIAAGGLAVIVMIVVLACYAIVSINAGGRTFDDPDDVPQHEYGLLLGTSPVTPYGGRNFYFDNRVKAAAELYKAGKIRHIIASGGDYSMDEEGHFRKNGCNELRAMRDSLEKLGVPRTAVSLDYDGTRTLNSIVKLKDVYGIDSCVVISQKYHNERAIRQADHYGLEAVGYNAPPSPILRNRIKNQARELLARVKLFIDLYLTPKPTFNTYAYHKADGRIEDWRDVRDSIPGLPGAVAHLSDAASAWGHCKYFSTVNGQPLYYNGRHGYCVLLPEGFGYEQGGERMRDVADDLVQRLGGAPPSRIRVHHPAVSGRPGVPGRHPGRSMPCPPLRLRT